MMFFTKKYAFKRLEYWRKLRDELDDGTRWNAMSWAFAAQHAQKWAERLGVATREESTTRYRPAYKPFKPK